MIPEQMRARTPAQQPVWRPALHPRDYTITRSRYFVRALAKALSRETSNHADVKALAGAGLLEATARGVRADYDDLETRIAI